MELTPYLIFDGRCEEAMHAYAEALGGSVVFSMPWADAPERWQHGRLEAPGLALHAMDGPTGQTPPNDPGPMVLLGAGSPEDATRVFDALAAGGQVTVPVAATDFAGAFGMLTDAFGVRWTITGWTRRRHGFSGGRSRRARGDGRRRRSGPARATWPRTGRRRLAPAGARDRPPPARPPARPRT